MQMQMLKNAPTRTIPYKEHADNIDAFVYMVLADADIQDKEMMEYIYRDRNEHRRLRQSDVRPGHAQAEGKRASST